jgi:mannitol/fructose-specific phosphotransferase system IIA component (Ntr-type)
MKIHKLINPENVYLDLEASGVKSALAAVADVFSPGLELEPERVVEALVEREELGSTSVGEGFAIPHCKTQGLAQIAIALARFTDGIDFEGTGHDPVRFVFVVLSPPDQPAAHLQVLSQIARVLKRRELRSELLSAADASEVVSAICRVAEEEGL